MRSRRFLVLVVAVGLWAATSGGVSRAEDCSYGVTGLTAEGFEIISTSPLDADGLESVIVKLITFPGQPKFAVVLERKDGQPRWWEVLPPQTTRPVAFHVGPEVDGAPGRDFLTLWLEQTPCEVVKVAAVRGRDGRVLATGDLGPTRLAGEDESNVISIPGHVRDFTGDGREDAVVENRAYYDNFGAAHVYTWEGRDVTPGWPKRGWVSVVDGSSAQEVFRVDKPLSLGPGPIAGFSTGPDGTELATLLDGSPVGDEFRARVAAFDYTGGAPHRRWERTVDVLPNWGEYFDLAGGPAFRTGRYGFYGHGLLVPGGERLTALDRATGATRWSADWPGTQIVDFDAVDGDLMVNDPLQGIIERRSGLDGRVLWRSTYVPQPLSGFPEAAKDQDGDGVTDFLIYSGIGPVVFSGATGGALLRPLAAADALFVVDDLDGDGADDLVGVKNSQVLTAYDGRTGRPFWHAPFPPAVADVSEFVAAGHLRNLVTRDVVVERNGVDITAFDGVTGQILWTRPDPQ